MIFNRLIHAVKVAPAEGHSTNVDFYSLLSGVETVLVNFGSVQRYNIEKGFGFVSYDIRKLNLPKREIFFHIKTIRRYSNKVANKLEDGLFSDVSFWYEIEKGKKGNQVNKIWLSVQDIPPEEFKTLVTEVENLWHDISRPLPPWHNWLDSITINLVGQLRRDELKHERENLEYVKQEAEQKERQEREAKKQQLLEITAEEKRKKQAKYQAQVEAAQERLRIAAEQARKQEAERQAQIKGVQEEMPTTIGPKIKRASKEFWAQQRESMLLNSERANRQQAERRIQSMARIKAIKEEKEKLVEQQRLTRKVEIEEICRAFKIKQLVHFTHIHNLYSILQHGLLGRTQLERMSLDKKPRYNDELRLDGQPQAICLSISFPNYKMFNIYSRDNRSDWVVLLIKIPVLWEMDCKFYYDNAASNIARQSEISGDRKHPSALKQMFEDYGSFQRHTFNLPDNFTTNPQAEVLVLNPIPSQYIQGVHFYDFASYQRWIQLYPGSYSQDFFQNRYYFSPRQDWQMW